MRPQFGADVFPSFSPRSRTRLTRRWRTGALLGGLAVTGLLSGCTSAEQVKKDRQAQTQRIQATRYRQLCVAAIERYRVADGRSGQDLSPLNGQACASPLLAPYGAVRERAATVQDSLISIDPERLSDYTVRITGLDGQAYVYRDDGKRAAALQEAAESLPLDEPVDAGGGQRPEAE